MRKYRFGDRGGNPARLFSHQEDARTFLREAAADPDTLSELRSWGYENGLGRRSDRQLLSALSGRLARGELVAFAPSRPKKAAGGSKMDAAAIARIRAAFLLRGFAGQGPAPVIALSPDLVDLTERRLGCTKTRVGRLPLDEGFALIHPNQKEMSSVWVLASVNGYKKVYETFLEMVYGTRSAKTPQGYQVDHLRAKSITPPNCYIRLEAVLSSVNASHGGGYESQMKESTVTQGRLEAGHVNGSMSWMVAMKLAGVLSPVLATNPKAAQRRAAAIAVFSGFGLSRREIDEGLDSLEALAARRASV